MKEVDVAEDDDSWFFWGSSLWIPVQKISFKKSSAVKIKFNHFKKTSEKSNQRFISIHCMQSSTENIGKILTKTQHFYHFTSSNNIINQFSFLISFRSVIEQTQLLSLGLHLIPARTSLSNLLNSFAILEHRIKITPPQNDC